MYLNWTPLNEKRRNFLCFRMIGTSKKVSFRLTDMNQSQGCSHSSTCLILSMKGLLSMNLLKRDRLRINKFFIRTAHARGINPIATLVEGEAYMK